VTNSKFEAAAEAPLSADRSSRRRGLVEVLLGTHCASCRSGL